jgi:hypothetical protein
VKTLKKLTTFLKIKKIIATAQQPCIFEKVFIKGLPIYYIGPS